MEDQTLEGKESLIKQLEDSKPRPVEKPNYALKLEEERKVHLVLWGPRGCGKTQLAKGLAKRHERGIINMSEIFDWNIAHKTEAAEKCQAALEMRKEAIDGYIADKEKERKKKKLKKGEELEPINVDHFNWLEHELVTELLVERLKAPDCNAGVIFDNLRSKNYENELVAVKAIVDACTVSKVQLVNMVGCKSEVKELPESHCIEPVDIAAYLGTELSPYFFKPNAAAQELAKTDLAEKKAEAKAKAGKPGAKPKATKKDEKPKKDDTQREKSAKKKADQVVNNDQFQLANMLDEQ